VGHIAEDCCGVAGQHQKHASQEDKHNIYPRDQSEISDELFDLLNPFMISMFGFRSEKT
jgi:hypothetical protein